MKRHLLLTIAVLCCLSLFATNKVILNPATETNNTDMMLVVSKIEMTDTETILYFDAYQRPGYWIRIGAASVITGSNQRTYKLIGSDGIVPGEETYLSESGHIAFSLRFQPVDKNEKSISFKEGDGPGDWAITGIKLYEEKQPVKPIQCVLRGEVIDRPQSSRLLLVSKREDMRISSTYIPIRDGKFEYTLNGDYEKEYDLVFYDEMMNGAWRPIPFISRAGVIEFKLYPMADSDKNSVSGGPLNTKYYQYKESVAKMYKPLSTKSDSLRSSGLYYTPEFTDLIKQQGEALDAKDESRLDSLNNRLDAIFASGEAISSEGKAIEDEAKIITGRVKGMLLNYVKETPDLLGYSLLVDAAWSVVNYEEGDATPYIDLFNAVYADKYPDHPYTREMNTMIGQLMNIKVGGKYIDFTAPDMAGNRVRVSDVIKGKVALIHLWAPWCGSCRRNGIAMIPVYEAYKDKGFTVVGVARERDSLQTVLNAIQKDQYPWMNLVDLNGKENVWPIYGVGNAGGGEFLVDENGVILAINPIAEAVRTILEERLK